MQYRVCHQLSQAVTCQNGPAVAVATPPRRLPILTARTMARRSPLMLLVAALGLAMWLRREVFVPAPRYAPVPTTVNGVPTAALVGLTAPLLADMKPALADQPT